jgi:inner membrane protein
MDSLSQLALGAAVGVAVMGRRTAPWKAALWGGLCGTLPDLDVFIDHGDPIRNMTLHRAHSHGLTWLTLAAPPIAWLAARVHGERAAFRRWWLALWLALFTHPLLDTMTVYGTQLAQPFSDHPFGLGSVFIIDPAYTLPLVVGVIAALRMPIERGLRWNHLGLLLSTLYLGWGLVGQHQVRGTAERALAAQGIAAERVLVTPTPFNSVLWRVVAMTPDGYHEGFRSLLDDGDTMRFDRFDRGTPLYQALAREWAVGDIGRFSRGFFALAQRGDRVTITDLRMGQEPAYVFSFEVAERRGDGWAALAPTAQVGFRGDVGRGLDWLWRRALGADLPPPR